MDERQERRDKRDVIRDGTQNVSVLVKSEVNVSDCNKNGDVSSATHTNGQNGNNAENVKNT